mmetsp:Transcript_118396/g.334641  ORF Transcript_118396/g.334641 Transcript_118396/m.334641 type:complete len:129 (-) Transcript_118396:104-490(-)
MSVRPGSQPASVRHASRGQSLQVGDKVKVTGATCHDRDYTTGVRKLNGAVAKVRSVPDLHGRLIVEVDSRLFGGKTKFLACNETHVKRVERAEEQRTPYTGQRVALSGLQPHRPGSPSHGRASGWSFH